MRGSYYPRGIWHKDNEVREAGALEPDTILVRNRTCVIIDAKCYPYFFEGWVKGDYSGLPPTSSIQKQITYGDYVFNQVDEDAIDYIDKDKIYNCFILPYNKEYDGSQHDNIKYVMYADTNWRKSQSSYDVVLVFFIDMRFVVEKWDESNHDKEIDCLINQIITNRERKNPLAN